MDEEEGSLEVFGLAAFETDSDEGPASGTVTVSTETGIEGTGSGSGLMESETVRFWEAESGVVMEEG